MAEHQQPADPTPSQWDQITARLDEGDARMGRIEVGLLANTSATKQCTEAVERMEAKSSGAIELAANLESFGKMCDWVLRWSTKLWKPISFIALTVSSVLAAWFTVTGKGGK